MPQGDNGGAVANPVAVTVITDTRNLRSPEFRPGADQLATGPGHREGLEELVGTDGSSRSFAISRSLNLTIAKMHSFISLVGPEIARLAKSLPDPVSEVFSSYEKLWKNEDFLPQNNKHYARYIMLKMWPEAHEATATYATRVQEKAHECKFGDQRDERILEHLIQTVDRPDLIQKAIKNKWNLTQFIKEAAQTEETKLQMKDMQPRQVHAVHKKS
jgi:hypothetical protein